MVAPRYDLPDALGHFGRYGGTFVAETLIPALDELKEAYAAAQRDPSGVERGSATDAAALTEPAVR